MFDFQFVFFLKNIKKKNTKTLNFKNKDEFLENTFLALSGFPKTVLNNIFQNQ